MRPGYDRFDGSVVAGNGGLDAAVAAIPYPARDSQGFGFPCHRIAITDALDASRND